MKLICRKASYLGAKGDMAVRIPNEETTIVVCGELQRDVVGVMHTFSPSAFCIDDEGIRVRRCQA